MTDNNKTAFIVPYPFVPPKNGGHKAAYGFAEFLSKKMDLLVISTQNNPEINPPFSLERLLKNAISRYFAPSTIIRCYRLFKQEKIKRCIVHQPFIGLALLLVFKLLSIQFEIYVQNIEFQRFKSMKKWWWRVVFILEWVLLKRADRLLFISHEDQKHAIKIFKLAPKKCITIPYGTPYKKPPNDQSEARKRILKTHGFSSDDFLIIFFGPQTYLPNLQAVELIIDKINPILQEKAAFNYKFIICGGGLPEKHNKLVAYKDKNIAYLGFVEDIDLYVKAADIMINPVNTGGGVKTKIIEAIALGKAVVSSKTGAIGVNKVVCGNKLIEVEDFDYEAYAEVLIKAQNEQPSISPDSFYDFYYWGNIINNY